MKKKQRLQFIVLVLAALGIAVGLSLYALQDNISFFYSPREVKAFQETKSALTAPGHVFRLGGLVKKGSLKKRGQDLSVSFVVTDESADLRVEYKGLLPDLFREGQGVVARGSLNEQGVFVATELLAKHDEKYMPPPLARALEKAKARE